MMVDPHGQKEERSTSRSRVKSRESYSPRNAGRSGCLRFGMAQVVRPAFRSETVRLPPPGAQKDFARGPLLARISDVRVAEDPRQEWASARATAEPRAARLGAHQHESQHRLEGAPAR